MECHRYRQPGKQQGMFSEDGTQNGIYSPRIRWTAVGPASLSFTIAANGKIQFRKADTTKLGRICVTRKMPKGEHVARLESRLVTDNYAKFVEKFHAIFSKNIQS